ncbi:hypothetical protein GCM10011352_04410 [Marinobacterium zhoushanense]|uniref:Uncharacterized protein n=1 Tax=Marinobacterium zhoushanense TaxID=1679163 RepID=A0ABQ1JZS8_9GAMM|nr:hypothetical protein GCM10011352_04410 [Marinobacterium zhoushanense]
MDLLRGSLSSLGKLEHFVSDDGKSATMLAGTCSFYCRVKCKQIGLIRYLLNKLAALAIRSVWPARVVTTLKIVRTVSLSRAIDWLVSAASSRPRLAVLFELSACLAV